MSLFYSAGLFDAIPDAEAPQKLSHRWYLSEDTPPFVDQIGSADSTSVTGTTQVTGEWVDGAARDGDGADDVIETTTLGPFGSDTSTDHAIAYSIQTTAASGAVAGADGLSFAALVGSPEGSIGSPDGHPGIEYRDALGNSLRVYADQAVNDGNPHRVCINKTSNSGSGIEFYIDGSSVSTTVSSDQGYTDPDDFTDPFALFAKTTGSGGTETYLNAILDDLCLFDDSLTSSEATSYDSPW